jgi:metallophosphoesterase (TIGR00282 family)
VRILFVGDIFGAPGMRAFKGLLGRLKKELRVDLVIANGENVSGGFGINAQLAKEVFKAGADVITTGNHVWDRRELIEQIGSLSRVLRPHNLPKGAPGSGLCVVEVAGRRVAVLNLMGRIFMNPYDCPFRTADEVLDSFDARPDAIIVDFHAEATSEKQAMGYYLDGRVSAVVGTHTHVATADARVLEGGTGYISDVGMTGVRESVIGGDAKYAIRRFVKGVPGHFIQAKGRAALCGVLLELDNSGKCTLVRRIEEIETT